MKNQYILIAIAILLVFSKTSLAQSTGDPQALVPDDLKSSHEKAKKQMKDKGYFEQLDRIPVSEYMLQRMNLMRVENKLNKKPQTLENLGFQKLENYDDSNASFAYKTVFWSTPTGHFL